MNNPKPNKKPTYPPLRYLSPIHRVTRQIHDHLAREFAEADFTGTEGHLISYLGSYAPVPVGDMVRVFGIKKSTITGMLDRLETAGMIKRAVNPNDRRSFLVDLTPRGKKAAARVRAELEEFEATLDAELSQRDQQAFKRIIAAVSRVTSPTEADK